MLHSMIKGYWLGEGDDITEKNEYFILIIKQFSSLWYLNVSNINQCRLSSLCNFVTDVLNFT